MLSLMVPYGDACKVASEKHGRLNETADLLSALCGLAEAGRKGDRELHLPGLPLNRRLEAYKSRSRHDTPTGGR